MRTEFCDLLQNRNVVARSTAHNDAVQPVRKIAMKPKVAIFILIVLFVSVALTSCIRRHPTSFNAVCCTKESRKPGTPTTDRMDIQFDRALLYAFLKNDKEFLANCSAVADDRSNSPTASDAMIRRARALEAIGRWYWDRNDYKMATQFFKRAYDQQYEVLAPTDIVERWLPPDTVTPAPEEDAEAFVENYNLLVMAYQKQNLLSEIASLTESTHGLLLDTGHFDRAKRAKNLAYTTATPVRFEAWVTGQISDCCLACTTEFKEGYVFRIQDIDSGRIRLATANFDTRSIHINLQPGLKNILGHRVACALNAGEIIFPLHVGAKG